MSRRRQRLSYVEATAPRVRDARELGPRREDAKEKNALQAADTEAAGAGTCPLPFPRCDYMPSTGSRYEWR